MGHEQLFLEIMVSTLHLLMPLRLSYQYPFLRMKSRLIFRVINVSGYVAELKPYVIVGKLPRCASQVTFMPH